MKYTTALLLICLSFFSCQTGEDTGPPNIVIIFTDDQGYQDVGCFGSPDIQTPRLDKMAAEGVRFTQFYAAQPVCSASRAALLTGCYPDRLNIYGAFFPRAKSGLHPSETTIAEMLKPLGYATAIFGKWHLGDHPSLLPSQQGFDEYFGIPFSNDMWPHHPHNERHNFDPLPLFEGDSVIEYLDDQTELTTRITEYAVDFIQRKKDQPFLLYVPHPQPHVPLFVSSKYAGTAPERGLYGDVIQEIDWSVGQILDALQANGLDDNTLVIFTSDNGPWLSYGNHSGSALPLREGKGTTWEGGVREPFIARWPGKIPAGRTVDYPAMSIDLFPTIGALTGATLPVVKIDGKNIWPLLSGKGEATPRPEGFGFYYHRNHLHGVMSEDGRWKLYLPHSYRSMNGRPGGQDGAEEPYEQLKVEEMELYDLQADISESTNVIADHPAVVEELLLLAENFRATLGDELTERKGSEQRPAAKVNWQGSKK
jgi:arylsulfatase A-like enzyme